MKNTTIINILLRKIREVGEDKKTLFIEGEVEDLSREVIFYDDGTYSNGYVNFIAYTTNYIYINQIKGIHQFDYIKAIPRNPHPATVTFEELER